MAPQSWPYDVTPLPLASRDRGGSVEGCRDHDYMRVAGVGKSMGQDPTKWTGRHAVKVRDSCCCQTYPFTIRYAAKKKKKNKSKRTDQENMVIGLLAITAIPTVTGVGNAVSAQKRQNESMSKEQEKFHLTFMLQQNGKIEEVGQGVLVDKKVSSLPLSQGTYSHKH